MARIEGLNRVRQALRKRERQARKDSNVSVIVGYAANYALPVHENLEARHNSGQQAKYLEQPFREMAGEIASIVSRVAKATGSLAKGLLVAGMRLQRESQKIVPIKTGNLKGSAFTELE